MAEFGWGGLGGGFGGPGLPDIISALGQALLALPRDAPFARLPETMQTVTQASRQRDSDAAMAAVAQTLGYDPSLGINPQALSLLIGQGNLQKQLDVGADLNKTIGGIYSGTAGNLGLGAPAARQSAMPSGDAREIEQRFITSVPGLTNPIGRAAVAAYGAHESGYDPANVNRRWSDTSESGQPGTSGAIMSWRGPRLQGLYDFAATRGEQPNNISPETQAAYLASEDPTLVPRLNAAKTPEEAHDVMRNAWKFAGYDQPGGESAARLATTKAYLSRFTAPTEVANNEADVQRLEQQTGMRTPGCAEPGRPRMNRRPGFRARYGVSLHVQARVQRMQPRARALPSPGPCSPCGIGPRWPSGQPGIPFCGGRESSACARVSLSHLDRPRLDLLAIRRPTGLGASCRGHAYGRYATVISPTVPGVTVNLNLVQQLLNSAGQLEQSALSAGNSNLNANIARLNPSASGSSGGGGSGSSGASGQ